jgi:hypothetical protein
MCCLNRETEVNSGEDATGARPIPILSDDAGSDRHSGQAQAVYITAPTRTARPRRPTSARRLADRMRRSLVPRSRPATSVCATGTVSAAGLEPACGDVEPVDETVRLFGYRVLPPP